MAYNKLLLEKWLSGPDWGDFLERNNALAEDVSTERFKLLEKRYFAELKEKINYCLKILETNKDPLIYYTLASLYSRSNLDESSEYLYKRQVRFYCIKAIRTDRRCAKAWALLSYAYSWIAFIGNERSVRHIEKAIYCIKKAIKINPANEEYRQMLRGYYFERNEEYGEIMELDNPDGRLI